MIRLLKTSIIRKYRHQVGVRTTSVAVARLAPCAGQSKQLRLKSRISLNRILFDLRYIGVLLRETDNDTRVFAIVSYCVYS